MPRPKASSCTYSGVDRRRKGHGKSRDVAFVAKAPSLLVGVLPNSHASPNAPGIPTETSSPVERATPVLILHAKSVDNTAMDQESESHTSDTDGKVYIGQTSSLSFLYFLKRTIKGYIGSVPFTEEEGQHVTIDIPDSAVEGSTQILSFDEKCSLLDSYFEATSGILDLFTAYEIDQLLSEGPISCQNLLHQPSAVSGDTKAIFDLVFAIGAQIRGIGNDSKIATSYFLRARAAAFKGMLMSQTLDTVRVFTLLAFYTLGACNRNAASMFLGIAAKAAVILNLNATGNDDKLSEEEVCARIRVWNSVQNLDILSSFIFGRPKSLPAICSVLAESTQFDTGGGRNSRPLFTAMVKACNILDHIVDTLGKNNDILHVPTAEELLRQLRQWSRELPEHIRRFPVKCDVNATLQPADRQALLGSLHISCVHYFAVMLITRPFLVAYLVSRLRGKAPDNLISDPDEGSDASIKNSKVSRLAQVCISSAIDMVDMCVKAKNCSFTFRNLSLLEAWTFGAGLVLGFSVFGGDPRSDIENAFQSAQIILGDIALSSKQAQLYHNILMNLADAVKKYRQRVTEERNYTVQHYMDRILIWEASPDENNSGREGLSTMPQGSEDARQASTSRPQTIFDFAGLPSSPFSNAGFCEGNNDWLGGDFLDEHPGGASILLQYAGNDATKAFESIHEADILTRHLDQAQILGPVSTVLDEKKPEAVAVSETRVRLSSVISILDFEYAASQNLPPAAFAFLKSGSEDEHAAKWNRDSWKTIRFRPRVLRPIDGIDMSWYILGTKFAAPFFICPAGGAKLAHSQADLCLTMAAGRHHILHWVCNNSHISQKDMSDARAPDQTTFWQIYARSDLDITTQEVKQAINLGYKGFALTVDAVRAGKRERDLRVTLAHREQDGIGINDDDEEDDNFAREPSVGRPVVHPGFDWVSAMKWLRGMTDLPIAIKGIQCWEDAVLCMEYGAHPWLSNHGGRQLDSAPSAVETLVSMRQHCPEVFDKCEVIVDGGITRGSDIVKALALGAKGVGLGRPFLYSAAFGGAGVSKAIRILKNEVETTMALLGITSLNQLNPSYVCIPIIKLDPVIVSR
ncbi:FMN-dependent dehydrogenase [Aspergillus parasiticus SU-1]|uniref:FMN-dependent dehydrogenase n=1 Tax=Aspergillus parasiticus (strain ATCC 56775 / NRRL 5862 / SRRC 143 / SU-1) TaxID=1403190 RepID=A0A0F0I803_ASPPU|nr:FMN-dependent dehydrogenase [Aspergillus parasiticus SU-1]